MSQIYQVIVGNIGMVYYGPIKQDADAVFAEYVAMSRDGYGRAAFEPVTLLAEGAPVHEFVPPVTRSLVSASDLRLSCFAEFNNGHLTDEDRTALEDGDVSGYGGCNIDHGHWVWVMLDRVEGGATPKENVQLANDAQARIWYSQGMSETFVLCMFSAHEAGADVVYFDPACRATPGLGWGNSEDK